MTEELIAQRMSQEEIQRLATIIAPKNEGDEPVDVDKATAALNKMLGLSGRAEAFKKLVKSKKALVAMEREAFGIDVSVHKTVSPMADQVRKKNSCTLLRGNAYECQEDNEGHGGEGDKHCRELRKPNAWI